MFKVRSSVGEKTMTQDELAAMGVTLEAIRLSVSNAPCARVVTINGEVVGLVMVDIYDWSGPFDLFVLPSIRVAG